MPISAKYGVNVGSVRIMRTVPAIASSLPSMKSCAFVRRRRSRGSVRARTRAHTASPTSRIASGCADGGLVAELVRQAVDETVARRDHGEFAQRDLLRGDVGFRCGERGFALRDLLDARAGFEFLQCRFQCARGAGGVVRGGACAIDVGGGHQLLRPQLAHAVVIDARVGGLRAARRRVRRGRGRSLRRAGRLPFRRAPRVDAPPARASLRCWRACGRVPVAPAIGRP